MHRGGAVYICDVQHYAPTHMLCVTYIQGTSLMCEWVCDVSHSYVNECIYVMHSLIYIYKTSYMSECVMIFTHIWVSVCMSCTLSCIYTRPHIWVSAWWYSLICEWVYVCHALFDVYIQGLIHEAVRERECIWVSERVIWTHSNARKTHSNVDKYWYALTQMHSLTHSNIASDICMGWLQLVGSIKL